MKALHVLPLLLSCSFAVSLTDELQVSANGPSDSVADCNTARQRFRSASLDHILKSLFNADVALETFDIPGADVQLHNTRKLIVPVGCFHKGYLAGTSYTVSLHPNFTRCIDEHTIDAELANDRQFVLFLRRLSNGSLVLLEGGAVRAGAFNNKTGVICDLHSQTRARACRHAASATGCQKLATFLSLNPTSGEASREPYFDADLESEVNNQGQIRGPSSAANDGNTASQVLLSFSLLPVVSAVSVAGYCSNGLRLI